MKANIIVAGFAALLACRPAAAQGGSSGHPEFNLEIIAKKTCTTEPLTGTNRHVIFVQADFSDQPAGKTKAEINPVNKINLVEGPFQVLDGNACNADGAKFQLPANPYTCGSTDPNCEDPSFQKYNVMARLVGKPGTAMKIGTCGFAAGPDGVLGTPDDVATCSSENYVDVRKSGRSRFQDATKELTTVYADVNGDGTLQRVPLFDPRLLDYLWTVDTQGQAHAQLFFVAVGK
ncbi:MAG TPA: hypothetical protein VNI01_10450 [Elusimicrobiota bacterium]|nr:hypothetical protein [Elusimicrobiota bacterium]